jgi:hypothetical protein
MIPAGNHIDAEREEVVADLLGNSEAARRVLAVHNDEIGLKFTPQPRQMGLQSFPARTADDISTKK